MVVVTLILILAGGSVGAYLSFNKTQSINNDVRTFITEVNRVRTLASSLQYPTGCVSLKGYNLKSTLVSDNLSGVSVTADCDPEDIVTPPLKILSNSVFTADFDITFAAGSGYITSGTDQLVQIRSLSDPSLIKEVSIGVYGTITQL